MDFRVDQRGLLTMTGWGIAALLFKLLAMTGWVDCRVAFQAPRNDGMGGLPRHYVPRNDGNPNILRNN
jgi:uncharacterized membrane protein YjjP (DUF1212 family)